jgi:hypothetical protein
MDVAVGRISAAAAGVVLAAALLPGAPAMAGAPFRTDDPGTVDPGHWELDVFSAGNRHKQDMQMVAPGVELNYGLAEGVQLHIVAPMVRDQQLNGASDPDHYTSTYNYGDTELGVKIRLFEEDKASWQPEVAVFPLYEAPTGSKSDNTGKGHGTAFLPVWMGKTIGDFSVFGGGG